MAAINLEATTSSADACLVDLDDYRVATFTRRLGGRARIDAGSFHSEPGLREGADDLAKKIDRLLDKVGDCLAVMSHR